MPQNQRVKLNSGEFPNLVSKELGFPTTPSMSKTPDAASELNAALPNDLNSDEVFFMRNRPWI